MSRYIDLDKVEFLKVDGNEEFNHGVDCCVNRLLEAKPIKAMPLDRIKEAREEIIQLELIGYATVDGKRTIAGKAVFQIIDKLIAEVEENK